MIIKPPDEKKSQVAALQALQARPDASPDAWSRIEQEIRNIRAGARGEAEAAYEIDFHYANSRNVAVIHDLRIECGGRVAQIDHLLINRLLWFWVCESKHFAEGIAINEYGECSAFYKGRQYGVASPFEQNRKHVIVLNSALEAGMAALPTRLGFAIKPTMNSVVLVSKNARISRPKAGIAGLASIIKNDQLKSHIERVVESDAGVLTMARVIGSDTLEKFAQSVAALHRPITFNWAAKFGLGEAPPAEIPTAPSQDVRHDLPPQEFPTIPAVDAAPAERGGARPKQKLVCATCSQPVPFNVARFCWFNKARFGGNLYCMECQKSV